MGTFPKPMELSPADLKKECNKTMENSSVHLLCNETWSEADLSWSQSKATQGSCASSSAPQPAPCYRSSPQPCTGGSMERQTALGWAGTARRDCREPRVVVFHTGYLLPLPAALFWEQFHHLTINILGTGTLSTSLLVISVFL